MTNAQHFDAYPPMIERLHAAQFRAVRVGLRPAAVDGLPNVRGLFIAAGHGAAGLQLGPFSGKLTPFSVKRFRGKPDS